MDSQTLSESPEIVPHLREFLKFPVAHVMSIFRISDLKRQL